MQAQRHQHQQQCRFHPHRGPPEVRGREGLDIGFAYDGDADRCLCVDEKGNVITGDHIRAHLWLLHEGTWQAADQYRRYHGHVQLWPV